MLRLLWPPSPIGAHWPGPTSLRSLVTGWAWLIVRRNGGAGGDKPSSFELWFAPRRSPRLRLSLPRSAPYPTPAHSPAQDDLDREQARSEQEDPGVFDGSEDEGEDLMEGMEA